MQNPAEITGRTVVVACNYWNCEATRIIQKIVTGSPHEKLRVSILFCYTFVTII